MSVWFVDVNNAQNPPGLDSACTEQLINELTKDLQL